MGPVAGPTSRKTTAGHRDSGYAATARGARGPAGSTALLDQVLNAGLGAFAQHCLDTVFTGLGVVYSSLRPMISPLAST